MALEEKSKPKLPEGEMYVALLVLWSSLFYENWRSEEKVTAVKWGGLLKEFWSYQILIISQIKSSPEKE